MVLTVKHSPEVCLFYDFQWFLQCPAIRVEGQSEAKHLMGKWNCTSAGHYGLWGFCSCSLPACGGGACLTLLMSPSYIYLSSCLNARNESLPLGVGWWSLCVLSVRTWPVYGIWIGMDAWDAELLGGKFKFSLVLAFWLERWPPPLLPSSSPTCPLESGSGISRCRCGRDLLSCRGGGGHRWCL